MPRACIEKEHHIPRFLDSYYAIKEDLQCILRLHIRELGEILM